MKYKTVLSFLCVAILVIVGYALVAKAQSSTVFLASSQVVSSVNSSSGVVTLSNPPGMGSGVGCGISGPCGSSFPTFTLTQGQVLLIDALDQAENDITKMKVGDRVTVYFKSGTASASAIAVRDGDLMPPGCDVTTHVCTGTTTIVPSLPPVPPVQINGGIQENLSLGMNGASVTALQQKLQALGYFSASFTPTGYFGLITKQAVIKYQEDKGLPATGYVGSMTRATLGN
jgi:putative peptidoglycan binding protein